MSGQPNRWPVYKGESFNIWNPDTRNYYASVDSDEIKKHLQTKRLKQFKTPSSPFAEYRKEHVEDTGTLPCLKPRIAFRNTTNPTNTRTLVTALVPGNVVIANSAPYMLFPKGTCRDEAYLLGVLSSMVLDWSVRRVVELALNFFLLEDLSIPDPGENHPVRDRVVEIAGRLAAVDERFSEWAEEVGVPVGSATDKAVKYDLICELDACVAHLYNLDEEDLEIIYDTFSATVDYSDRHVAVLAHYQRIAAELAELPKVKKVPA